MKLGVSYIRMKLENSSNRCKHIDKIVAHYENWEYPNDVMWANGKMMKVVVLQVFHSNV